MMIINTNQGLLIEVQCQDDYNTICTINNLNVETPFKLSIKNIGDKHNWLFFDRNITIKHFPANIFTDYKNFLSITCPICRIEEFKITDNFDSKVKEINLSHNKITQLDSNSFSQYI